MAVLRLVIIRVCHVIFYKKILLLLLLGYEILRLIHRRIPHSVVTIHQVLVVLIGLSYMVRLRLLIHVVAGCLGLVRLCGHAKPSAISHISVY